MIHAPLVFWGDQQRSTLFFTAFNFPHTLSPAAVSMPLSPAALTPPFYMPLTRRPA